MYVCVFNKCNIHLICSKDVLFCKEIMSISVVTNHHNQVNKLEIYILYIYYVLLSLHYFLLYWVIYSMWKLT